MTATVASGAAVAGGIIAASHSGQAPPVYLPAAQAAANVAGIQQPRDTPARTPDLAVWVRVREGDTLSGIAQRDCGREGDWTGIYDRNQKAIGPDYNLIQPREELALDCRAAALPARAVTTAYVAPPGPRDEGGSQPARVQAVQPAAITAHAGGGNLSFSGLEALWEAAGGPAWAAAAAATVAECESGGRQYAYNPSGASGYWQILGEVVPGNVFDPMINAENAVAKFRASGDTWAQWVCRP